MRDVWHNNFQEERVPYVNAIVKEGARCYTVSTMSIPQKTVSEVKWGNATIPARTMILINAQAANHDVDPGCWLDAEKSTSSVPLEKMDSGQAFKD